MNREVVENEVAEDFIRGTKDLFQENLLFGFICGGFAKGYWDEHHDIDTFICVRNPIERRVALQYLRWYHDIHHKHGFPPDDSYPGEIAEKNILLERLAILHNFHLNLEVSSIDAKEAILWADMIVGKKMAIIGNDLDLLDSLQKAYGGYPEKWKREVLELLPDLDRSEWKDKSYLLIMERFMKYTQSDARCFYRKYGIN